MSHGLFYRCPYYVSGSGNISVALLSMEGQKALGFYQKYLHLNSEDERRSYGFGTTWGWVINDFLGEPFNNGKSLVSYKQLFASQSVRLTGVMWITGGLLWSFYKLSGLSFWRQPFIPLVSQLCNTKLLWICFDEETLIYNLDGLRVKTFSANGWTAPLMQLINWGAWFYYYLIFTLFTLKNFTLKKTFQNI